MLITDRCLATPRRNAKEQHQRRRQQGGDCHGQERHTTRHGGSNRGHVRPAVRLSAQLRGQACQSGTGARKSTPQQSQSTRHTRPQCPAQTRSAAPPLSAASFAPAHLRPPPHQRRRRHARFGPCGLVLVEQCTGNDEQAGACRTRLHVLLQVLLAFRRPSIGREHVEHIRFTGTFSVHAHPPVARRWPGEKARQLLARPEQKQAHARLHAERAGGAVSAPRIRQPQHLRALVASVGQGAVNVGPPFSVTSDVGPASNSADTIVPSGNATVRPPSTPPAVVRQVVAMGTANCDGGLRPRASHRRKNR